MGIVKEFLADIGRLSSLIRSSKPSPTRSGYWVNNGTEIDEDWVWVDPTVLLKPIYLNIYEEDGNIIMSQEQAPRLGALECISCNSIREFELMVKFLSMNYKRKGNVVILPDEGNV